MEIVYLIIGLVIGIVVVVGITKSHRRQQIQWRNDYDQLSRNEKEIRELWVAEKQKNASLEAQNKALEEKNEYQSRQAEERLQLLRLETEEKLTFGKKQLEDLKTQMYNEFRLMSNTILEEKSERFTRINKENIDRILSPLQEKITEFKQKVEDTYDRESKERFSLDNRIKELVELNQRISQEANNLTKALKGDSKVQGDWGEVILERILEKSGLIKGEEYFTQETLNDETGKSVLSEEGKKMRPDVIIVYPDNRKVIIDSKASLTAYSRSVDAETPEEMQQARAEHVRSVRLHIDELGAKGYQDYIDTLDFVMMFIPNEAAYIVAMQQEPDLWQYAYNKRVLIISPTNLIAALKLIVDLWKREKQSRNAIEIAERGARLYDKFVGFVEQMTEIGNNLDKTQKVYQKAFNQLKDGRGNLINQAEQLMKLGVKAKKQLPFEVEDEE